jgi:hypothetical protein
MSTFPTNTDFFNTPEPVQKPVQKPVDPPVDPVDPPVDPVDPPVDPPVDDECPPEPCEIIPVPMNVEIQPDITICVDKPKITLKNYAVCICTPCKEKTK